MAPRITKRTAPSVSRGATLQRRSVATPEKMQASGKGVHAKDVADRMERMERLRARVRAKGLGPEGKRDTDYVGPCD